MDKGVNLTIPIVDIPPIAVQQNEQALSIALPKTTIPTVQGPQNEQVNGFSIPTVDIPILSEAKDEPLKKSIIPLSGKLITAEDPMVIGKNFRTLINMRYGDSSPQTIGGMTKINATYDLDTYLKVRNAHHFRKIQPAETTVIETHILAQAYNAAGTGSTVIQNETAPPSAGEFTGSAAATPATALWTDPTSTGYDHRGRFSDAPQGRVAYCNGADTCIWGGNGIPVAGFITSTAAVTTAPTNPKDYTEVLQNTKTDSENLAIIGVGGGNDANTVLLLHADGADASTTITDTAVGSDPAKTIAAMGNSQLDTSQARFGLSSILFDGAGDYLSTGGHADLNFGSAAFDIDLQVRFNVLPTDSNSMYFWSQRDDADNLNAAYIKNTSDVYSLGFVVINAATKHELICTWTGVAVGVWYHLAFIRGWGGSTNTSAGWAITLDGNRLTVAGGTDNPTVATVSLAADFEIGRFNAGSYFNGWIDEFRVSKSVARWTATFSPPASAYAAGALVWLIRSPLPLQGVKYYIQTANMTASTMTCKEWNGYSWNSLTITDNTDTGASLAVTGTVTWASTVNTSKPKYIEGMLGYWYQFSISAGSAEIYHVTLDAPFQRLLDIWDGIDRTIPAFFIYTTVYADNTIGVFEDYYDSTDAATYADLSSLGAYNSETGANCLILGFFERMTAFNILIPPAMTNGTAGVIAIDYWAGDDWAQVANAFDGTSEGGAPFAKSGVISFSASDPWNVFKRVLANNSIPLYYYRIRNTGALDASTQVYYISGIPTQQQIRGYKFPLYSQDRLMLCCNMDGKRNSVKTSALNTCQVFNGDDSYDLEFGNGEELNCGCTVFSQFGSNLYNITMFFSDKEIWGLVRSGETWQTYKISASIGCPAPLTLDTIIIPPSEGQQQQNQNRHLAIWMGANGVYVSDGRHPTDVSHDIRDIFNQNSDVHINLAAVNSFSGFADKSHEEYHLFVTLSTTVTTSRDAEFVLDLRRFQWYHVDRASGKRIQCGISVVDNYGNPHSYGFIDTGYMERLENGTTFDGNSIVSILQLGDFPLEENDLLTKTSLQAIVPVLAAKRTTTANVALTDFINTEDEILTLDVAPGTAWVVGDTVTGATSASRCELVRIYSTTIYAIKNRVGNFTLGEILSNGTYTADQGSSFPTVTGGTEYSIDPTLAYYRITSPVKRANSKAGIFHSIRMVMVTSDETYGFEPYLLGLYYHPLRERNYE